MKKIDFRTDILPLKNELYRLALRITLNSAEAEDVVQETMIKVWKRRDRWGEIESIEAFCLAICRNLARDKAKRADNRVLSTDAAGSPADDGAGYADGRREGIDSAATSLSANPEAQAERQDSIALVKRLIDSLPEKQRSVMQLRDIEGKPYKEIAGILGISEEQVKVNLFRARQTIKKKYIETETYGL